MWNLLEPRLLRIVRKSRSMVRVARRDDSCRDVVVAVMARLRSDGFHRLNLYVDAWRRDPELTFMRWLVVLARRVETEPLPDGDGSGARPPMTSRVA